MSSEATKLKELIKKAIADLQITTTEYNEILEQANSDMVIDSEEQALLKQLNEMIANKTIDRVPG
jgi:hypothetical protein